jgi:hypothetical protein
MISLPFAFLALLAVMGFRGIRGTVRAYRANPHQFDPYKRR